MGLPKTTIDTIKTTYTVKKQDGTYTKNTTEAKKQWAEWIERQFHITPDKVKPEIQHITEEMWERIRKAQKQQTQTWNQEKQTKNK